ncbi:reverse transcriptase domain-containing protein [Tanacetum coccineum]
MSPDQTTRMQVAENANSNKEKVEGNHNGKGTIKGGNTIRCQHDPDCSNPAAAKNQRNSQTFYECVWVPRHFRARGTSQNDNDCYECGNQGHCRSDCPERKNRNHENQTRGAGARGAVHALREGETDQDPNNIKDEIKA